MIFLTSVKIPGDLEVHAVSNDWTEAPTGALPAPGFGAAPLATIPAAAVRAKQFIIVDVTDTVKAWLEGTSPDFGFAITSKDGIADAQLGAKEGFAKGYPAGLEMEVDRGDAGIWSLNGSSTYYDNGSVGIGTASPKGALQLASGGLAVTGASSPYTGTTAGIFMESYASGGFLFAYDYASSSPQPLLLNSPGGNVGIGTTTPANKLTLLATGHGFEHTNGAVRLGTYVDAAGGWLGTLSNSDLKFFVNDGGASMTVDTDGNVGIGTPSPTSKLAVAGDTQIDGRLNVNSDGESNVTMTLKQRSFGDDYLLRAKDFSGADALTLSHSTGGNHLGVYGDASKSSGGTSWGTISDQRLKQDVRQFESGLNEVLQLRPVRFHYRDGIKPGLSSAQEEVGFIAQEVREVIPDAVTVGEDGYLMLKADPIHWAAINAIRELNTKIEQQADVLHASIESSEALSLYSGNVTTDANGDATVMMPKGFEALDHDFRYQLTVIGQFAQAIVSSEIKDHRFEIKTDKPSVKVSWQVTSRRDDAYAQPLIISTH